MPFLDIEAANESLDNDYDGKNLAVELWVGDPKDGGVQINDADCPGYEPYVSAAADPDRDAAVDGVKQLCVASFTATTAWELKPDWMVVRDTDSGFGWDCLALDEAVDLADLDDAGTLTKAINVFDADSVDA